jgi:predicted metal-dependent phosphoesterase TrpH
MNGNKNQTHQRNRMNSTITGLGLLSLILQWPVLRAEQAEDFGRVIDANRHHLGDSDTPGWKDTKRKPEGFELKFVFEAKPNPKPLVLSFLQRHVQDSWKLILNEEDIGDLPLKAPAVWTKIPIPANTLKDGSNTLTVRVVTADSKDDIVIGPFHLNDVSFKEWARFGKMKVQVLDAKTEQPIPARITVTNMAGQKVKLTDAKTATTAVRDGVVYVRPDGATASLPEGDYMVYATRGMEWSAGAKQVAVKFDEETLVQLNITREVDTSGFVACDTHIHTLTFSGHGNATIEERMITIPGEGIDLAIATDHNYNTDYAPFQKKMGLSNAFASIRGNEVTTRIGHFNSFPLDPDDPVPGGKKGRNPLFLKKGWPELLPDIRARGAKFIILNHPHWPSVAKGPHSVFGLNRASGDRANEAEFAFDGMELVNSGVAPADPLLLFSEWFALLNRGETITAVGSSDSHTVEGMVGEGRTYLRCEAAEPAKINLEEIFQTFREGDSTISLGIFTEVTVNGSFSTGDTVSKLLDKVNVTLRVASSSWVRPRQAIIFVNGKRVDEMKVPTQADLPTDHKLNFVLPKPRYDAHLVCVVLGEGVKTPWWPTKNKHTLGATNPVYLDVDGDGKYTTPRDTARARLKKLSTETIAEALRTEDPVIGVQVLALAVAEWPEKEKTALKTLAKALTETDPLYALYFEFAYE